MIGKPPTDQPLFKQTAQQLAAEIETGFLSMGATLPSETMLAEIFAVSRSTVRQSLETLVKSKLVEKSQGRQTSYKPCKPSKLLSSLDSLHDELDQPQMRTRVLSSLVRSAQLAEIVLMELNPSDQVRVITRVRQRKNLNVVMQKTTLPVSLTENLQISDIEKQGLYPSLRNICNITIGRTQDLVDVVVADTETAKLFKLSQDAMVMRNLRIGSEACGNVIEMSTAFIMPEHFRIRVDATN